MASKGIHNRSDYGLKSVGFNVCNNLKMTLFYKLTPQDILNGKLY